MSGIDPTAAAGLVRAVQGAMQQATLELAVPAQLLRATLHAGDLIEATVLAPENGVDLIDLLGQRVTAELPPDVRPGETLVLQVTGFTSTQITVRNLGVQDPQNPVPVSTPQFAPQPAPQQPAPQATVRPTVQQTMRAPQMPQTQRVQQPQQPPQMPKSVPPPPLFAAAPVVQRVVRGAGDLLRAVKFPDTPVTRSIAALAPQAPARLPSVLARLEAALPRESDDTRVATLKTLIAFTARIDPKNAQTLPAQIAAYVSHVLEGAEPKLQQLLQALVQTAPLQEHAAPPQQRAEERATPPPEHRVEHAPPPTVAHARAAERSAALEHNLKAVVLSLLRNPPAVRTPTLMQALNETFVTLTATQLNTLSTNVQTPTAITFSLPVFFHEGGKPAQLRISRESGSGGGKLDAENFHVAFLLDTANLGTVAVDLQSSGRSVKIDVKTQDSNASARFSQTLGSLRERLEQLRYRVVSASAAAFAPGRKSAEAREKPRGGGLDLQA